MDAIQRFGSREKARNVVRGMVGYERVRVVKMDAGEGETYWAVEVQEGNGDPRYMRESGQVA